MDKFFSFGTSLETKNTAEIDRDAFGQFTGVTQKKKFRDRSYRVAVQKSRFDYVDNFLSDLSASSTLAVFIGDENDNATVTYGLNRQSIMTYESQTTNLISIDVRGAV